MKFVYMLLVLLLVLPSFALAVTDKTKPTLNSFSVSASTITEGDSVTIKYSVKDSGGAGLQKVELWKGKSKNNLGPIQTNSAKGNGPSDGKFTDKPSSGTFYYGIHVIDNAGNVAYDNGAKSVTVKARDTTKPTLVSFSVDKSSVKKGDTVTISYQVRDSGGSGLKQVELWKGDSRGNLRNYKQNPANSDSASGKFTDTPDSGTVFYGVHVLDNSGNLATDNGALPVTVVSAGDKIKPTIVSFSVSKPTINKGDTVTILYQVRDSGGSRLKQVELWKGDSKGNLRNYKQFPANSDSASGKFTDTPDSGTVFYGIHVLDNSGNLATDNGALPVTVVSAGDKIKPTIVSFSVSKPTINKGETVTILYQVRDSGGSGLKQVELWKGDSKGNLRNYKQFPANGGAASGQFTDTPDSGTAFYGIHVLDNSGNLATDNGALPVTVASSVGDKVKPVVNSFGVNKPSMNLGETVNISYTVSDATGLKQVELWRSPNNKDWTEVANKRQMLSGKTQASGMFTDKPDSVGTYFYGMHVVDNAGNWNGEVGVKKVIVTANTIMETDFNWKYPPPVPPEPPNKNRDYCLPQCVDFVKYNLNLGSNGNAENYWKVLPKGFTSQYGVGSNRAPHPGDILVWDKWPGNTSGHVAIVINVDLPNQKIKIAHSNYDLKCNTREEWLVINNKESGYFISKSINDKALKGWLSKQ